MRVEKVKFAMNEHRFPRRAFIAETCRITMGACAAAAWAGIPGHALAGAPRCEARHYQKLSGRRIQCFVCPLNCILDDGETCFCRTRTNMAGTLYNLAYNNPCVLNVDPVEKGPLYHVLPGKFALALGTAGCNMRCLYCQNWEVSQSGPTQTRNLALDARSVCVSARKKSCSVVAFTYTEPVVFSEYVCDTAAEAHRENLRTHVASAAFINPEPLREMCKVIDAFTLSLKGFSEEFYRKVCGTELAPVLEAMKVVKSEGNWLEIVNLILPTLNDDAKGIDSMCRWIVNNLGDEVPLHFARFYPAYRLKNLPLTPQSTMERAHKIARDAGLRYVYLANLPGHPANNTYCHACGNPVVKRNGLKTLSVDMVAGKCRYCKAQIPGLWS
jgi:pyruvate formate lyase activating enzyme